MSFTIFKMSCSLLEWVFVVVKWVENEFLIVQSCIYKNVCIFCGFRCANQFKYWLTLTKNPAKMSFRLIEMSFTIFKMSLATFKMSFGIFFKMSFSQNARKKAWLFCSSRTPLATTHWTDTYTGQTWAIRINFFVTMSISIIN